MELPGATVPLTVTAPMIVPVPWSVATGSTVTVGLVSWPLTLSVPALTVVLVEMVPVPVRVQVPESILSAISKFLTLLRSSVAVPAPPNFSVSVPAPPSSVPEIEEPDSSIAGHRPAHVDRDLIAAVAAADNADAGRSGGRDRAVDGDGVLETEGSDRKDTVGEIPAGRDRAVDLDRDGADSGQVRRRRVDTVAVDRGDRSADRDVHVAAERVGDNTRRGTVRRDAARPDRQQTGVGGGQWKVAGLGIDAGSVVAECGDGTGRGIDGQRGVGPFDEAGDAVRQIAVRGHVAGRDSRGAAAAVKRRHHAVGGGADGRDRAAGRIDRDGAASALCEHGGRVVGGGREAARRHRDIAR